MSVKIKPNTKDDVVIKLYEALEKENDLLRMNKLDDERIFLINKGWIEALKWVLNWDNINVTDI